MNANDFSFLLNNPTAIKDQPELVLDKIMEEFPYFQSARALQLKGLYYKKSFKYNQTLKITAAYTADRNVLFEYISTEDHAKPEIEEIIQTEESIAETKPEFIIEAIPDLVFDKIQNTSENKLEQSIINSINEATSEPEIPKPEETKIEETLSTEEFQAETQSIQETEVLETIQEDIEERLEIGQPLNFSGSEKHSFQEWLQLATLKPINREEPSKPEIEKTVDVETEIEAESNKEDEEKKKKLDLIDKFIEANPKISNTKNSTPTPVIIEQNNIETSYLMTETLAKVYLEQKKYQKAIQAYEILILKYPEKSSYFANRIADIKTLQQNNN
ncbi:MAG: tetratricopeptide repeat protein [Flavobacterium sp.]